MKNHIIISTLSLVAFSIGYFFFYKLYPSVQDSNFLMDTISRILPVFLMGLSFYFSIVLVFSIRGSINFRGKTISEFMLFFVSVILFISMIRFSPRDRSFDIKGFYISIIGVVLAFLSSIMAKSFSGKLKISIYLEMMIIFIGIIMIASFIAYIILNIYLFLIS